MSPSPSTVRRLDVSASIASAVTPRLSPGSETVWAASAKVTTPTRNAAGTRSRNVVAAAFAALRRSGRTSVASIESETSIASTTVAALALRSRRICANSSSRQVDAPNRSA